MNAEPQHIPPTLPSTFIEPTLLSMSETIGDIVMHCVMQLDTHIDEALLKRAVRLSMDAEPIVGCTYVEGWWRGHWRRRTDLDTLTLVQVQHTEDPTETLQTFMAAPLDGRHQPMVDILVLRQSTHDVICLKIDHLIVDAGGIKDYVYMLFDLYRALQAGNTPHITPNIDGNRELDQLLKHLPLKWPGWHLFWHRTIKDIRQFFLPLRSWHANLPRRPREQRRYAIRVIEPPLFRKLKRYGKHHGATVNDVIVSAYFRALYAFLQPKKRVPLRMMNTVDLRRYLPTRQTGALCNNSLFSYLNIGYDIGDSFEDTLGKVNSFMQTLKQEYIGLGDLAILPKALRVMPHALSRKLSKYAFVLVTKLYPPAMTNMGQIDTTQLSFHGGAVENAFLTASILYPPGILLGISGFGEQLTVTSGFCETAISREQIDKLIDLFIQELDSLTIPDTSSVETT
ncbi:MAG: hypothetical protein CL920_35825 [Deltaproteobacteria bacterium]|nr:hypothetical protein [Deltaproteobacteria bacterium]MBU54096.1 hypothetical protein [Deltaproteobacteria bacterium]